MKNRISERLDALVKALPLYAGIRVLEIGCGTGSAARAIAAKIEDGHILAIDRSEKAISKAISSSKQEMQSGKLSYRSAAIEFFELENGEQPFDLAFAARVGALDGRHPEIEKEALERIAAALKKEGRLFIDGGNPLREIELDHFRQWD